MKRQLLIGFAALALLAGACGGGSDDEPASFTQDSSNDAVPEDSGTSDDSSSDDSSSDAGSNAPSSFDCDEVREALEAAGDSAGFDPTAGGEDLEASYNEARQSLQALAAEAPELSDDIDAAIAGLDVIGAALEAIDWDPASIATNPEAALEFANLLNDPAVLGMTAALTNVSAWVANACS